MDFCVYISLFSVVDNTITLFNCFFRDFRGFRHFRDFWVFDLAALRKPQKNYPENVQCIHEVGHTYVFQRLDT